MIARQLLHPCAVFALLVVSGWAQAQPRMPGDSAVTSAPRDATHLARDLPPGTIVVSVRDQNGQPRPGQNVKLRIKRQSPAIGEKISTITATSNAGGEAVFPNLETHSEYSYAAEIPFQGALYGPAYSSLQSSAGLRIIVHTFPTTRSLDEAQIETVGLVAIEPSDTIFQCELALDVLNTGRITWLPNQYVIHLPPGAKAFDPWDRTTGRDAADDGTLRFEQHGAVAVLLGTVRPGQHRAGFRFQLANPGYRFLPWDQSEIARFELGLPPRVTQMTVISDEAPGMRLIVPGLPDARTARGPNGRPVFATGWVSSAGQERLPRVRVTLAGVPTRGTVPFLSVMAAALLLAWGFVGFRSTRQRALALEDAVAARKRLLDELWTLEQAVEKGRIGPKTHAAARRAIVAALARLEDPPKAKKSKRASRPTRRSGAKASKR